MSARSRRAAAALIGAATLWRVARRRARRDVRPRASRLRRWLDPYADIPSGRMVVPPLPPGEVVHVPERGEMFVRRAGHGEGVPIVLLHGWMASADLNWFPVLEELSADRVVLALDHRGHGRGIRAAARFTLEDCADDAAALLTTLGIERAVVVGYSMGGPIATLLWRRHPGDGGRAGAGGHGDGLAGGLARTRVLGIDGSRGDVAPALGAPPSPARHGRGPGPYPRGAHRLQGVGGGRVPAATPPTWPTLDARSRGTTPDRSPPRSTSPPR
jgi:pimeloyl-ACP methyl ester carboxylesterase